MVLPGDSQLNAQRFDFRLFVHSLLVLYSVQIYLQLLHPITQQFYRTLAY